MSFTRNKVTAVLGATVAIAGVGAGVPLRPGRGGPARPAPASVAAPAVNAAAPDATETTAPETGAAEPAGPDADNLQQGDQTTPDSPNEKADSAEGGTEKADANEPGGGHEDPPGAEVDHQFEGVE